MLFVAWWQLVILVRFLQTATTDPTESTATKAADIARNSQTVPSGTEVVPTDVTPGTSQTFVRLT